MEVVNAYSEQNCAKAQAEAFNVQAQFSNKSSTQNVDEELHRNDMDFVAALEYGMPPTAGWGCGIDRLCMLMCGVKNIREIILFPMHRTSLLGGKSKKQLKKESKE